MITDTELRTMNEETFLFLHDHNNYYIRPRTNAVDIFTQIVEPIRNYIQNTKYITGMSYEYC